MAILKENNASEQPTQNIGKHGHIKFWKSVGWVVNATRLK